MVGVANSVGCVTCRSRKVKCDLQRPSCGKCIKAGRECGGYKRDRVFIIGTQQDRGRCSSHPKRAPLIPKSNNKRSSKAAAYSRNNVDSPSSASTLSDTTLQRQSSGSPHPMVQSAFVNMRQFIVQNSDDFLMKPWFENSPWGLVPSLLDYLPEMANSSKLFNRGILAFCMLAAGKRHKDIRLNKASLKMSVDAMKEMQIVVLDPTQAHKVEVLAATICMSECEIMLREAYSETNQYYNWQGLLRGTSALVHERGPLSFSHYPDYQLFTRGFRGNGVLEAIGRRQHTFLASPEWLTIPWSRGIEKESADSCFDILAQLAGCLADVDLITWKAMHDPDLEDPCETDPKCLLKKLFGLADAMWIWFADFQTESNNLCTIRPADDIASPPPPIFPLVFSFPNFRIGMLHMYSWSALILIYDCIEKLQVFMEGGGQSDGSPFSGSSQTTDFENESLNIKMIREFSWNICQSADSLLETALAESWSVVHMLVFPLWIVLQCYQGRSEEESRFLAVFLRKMVDNDIVFAETLCNMSFEDYAKM